MRGFSMLPMPALALILFLVSSPAVSGYGQSLADCKEVAALFNNTCDHGNYDAPAASMATMASETQSCVQFKCIDGGTKNGNVCSWERKLCITCRVVGGVTKIRVQTNNLPNHCVKSISIKPKNFDYEVNFNTKETFGEWERTLSTQHQVDSAVCPIRKSFDEAGLGLVEYGEEESANAMGFAINGVAFQFANQIQEDPVYPITVLNEQPLDICLGHNQLNSESGMYHYHDISPCLIPNFLNDHVMGSCVDDAVCKLNKTSWALSGYSVDGWRTKKVIGISKDGRVVYGPYDSTGDLWTPARVDACNGAWSSAQDDYFYVGTRWHPYAVGCQGPSNFPHTPSEGSDEDPIYANCSLNGMENYVWPSSSPTPSPVADAPSPAPPPTAPADGAATYVFRFAAFVAALVLCLSA